MLQVGHNKMFSSFYKDNCLHHRALCAIVRCDTSYGFLWICGLQWAGDQEDSSLLSYDFVKHYLLLTEQKCLLLRLFTTNQKAHGFFFFLIYFCSAISYFSTDICHFFLFDNYVCKLISFYPVISVYFNSDSISKMHSIYMNLFPSWWQEHMHIERKLQVLGHCPKQFIQQRQHRL